MSYVLMEITISKLIVIIRFRHLWTFVQVVIIIFIKSFRTKTCFIYLINATCILAQKKPVSSVNSGTVPFAGCLCMLHIKSNCHEIQEIISRFFTLISFLFFFKKIFGDAIRTSTFVAPYSL